MEALLAASCEHRTFETKKDSRKQKNVHIHLATLPLPRGAIAKSGDDLVASPELVFLELAHELGFARTVLLGLQLCSHDVGKHDQALTTAAKIQRFVSKCEGHTGHKIAQRAAQFLADGSASIMESLLYMLLTLPNRHGGYGLAGAQFNHTIVLPKKASKSFGHDRITVDLYWEKIRLALEYDSYKFHANSTSWMRDARRMALLESIKVNALSVNTVQLYNRGALAEIALVIALQLGRRIRIRAAEFDTCHEELRALLPRTESGKADE